MSAKSTAITVAVIGGIATVGAALIGELHKGAEPAASPTIQQTASGAGAVNVGRDAVFNNTVAKSAAEESAERVQACEAQHGMKTSTEKKEWVEGAGPSNGDPGGNVEHEDFRFCDWPKGRYAEGDGYLEIRVRTANGPGTDEASDENVADRITAPCPQLALTYQFGHMGYSENTPPVTVSADKIVRPEGTLWNGDRRSLLFYPDPGEIVVLRNHSYALEAARCE